MSKLLILYQKPSTYLLLLFLSLYFLMFINPPKITYEYIHTLCQLINSVLQIIFTNNFSSYTSKILQTSILRKFVHVHKSPCSKNLARIPTRNLPRIPRIPNEEIWKGIVDLTRISSSISCPATSRSKCFNLSGRGQRTRSGRELLKERPVAGNWNVASRHGQLTISRRRILDADHTEFRFMDDASRCERGFDVGPGVVTPRGRRGIHHIRSWIAINIT